jgi:flagella basal body P-ring formation protein FlgA
VTSVLDQFEELKRKVAALAAKEANQAGEARVLTRQLKEAFGVATVKEGRKIREKLYTKEMADVKAYSAAYARFVEENAAELRKLDE